MQWKARLFGVGAALCFLAACGDDDGGAHDGTGNRSDAAVDAGKQPPLVVTPYQAVAGACTIRLVAGENFDDCTGFDQLEACTRRQCELELCVDQCSEYMACLYESSTPCDPACSPEQACSSCMQTITQCVIESNCIDTFLCVEQVEGGVCDELRECCDAQPGELRDQCTLVAKAAAAAQGEEGCAMFLQSVPSFANAVPCPD